MSSHNASMGLENVLGIPSPNDVRPCPFAVDNSLACAIVALAERPSLVRAAFCLPEGNSVRSGSFPWCTRRAECAKVNQQAMSDSDRHKRWDRVRRRGAKLQALQARETAGAWIVRLCVAGTWQEYVLDDTLPCHPGCYSDGSPVDVGGLCTSRAHGPSMWVSMLEKAYARANGSYTAALGGCFWPPSLSASGEHKLDIGSGSDCTPGSVVCKPAKVLAVFTGAPFLHVQIRTGAQDSEREGVNVYMDSQKLWRVVVSRTQKPSGAVQVIMSWPCNAGR